MEDKKVLLFDLGGVLIELGDNPFPSSCLGVDQAFKLSDWFNSEIAQMFERGQISAIKFAQSMKKELMFSCSSDQLLNEFTKWPLGPYAGTFELLEALSDEYTLAVLTNTNELHWPRIIEEFAISDYCSPIFASHLLGMAKPELAIYRHVLTELQVSAESVLFFDDNQSNIDAARTVGMQSYCVQGHADLVEKMQMLGLINKTCLFAD